MLSEKEIEDIIVSITKKLQNNQAEEYKVAIEASARHVHLSREDVDKLFGRGYELTPKRDLSQLGQFLCEERLRLLSAKGILENVAILGPIRKRTQVELSMTDSRLLGLKPPLRESGDLDGAESIFIQNDNNILLAKESTILVKNHIHMTPEDARKMGLRNGEQVSVYVGGERAVTFEKVIVRVSDKFKLAMHVDYDEANACQLSKNAQGIIKKR